MQLPAINIRSTHGQIAIQSNRPHLEIQQHGAAMSIEQTHAEIQISKQPSKLTINQREAFASANSKHIYRLNEEFAAKAMSHASQMTAKYAREGDQLMRIENGGEVIPRLAKANSMLFPDKELNIGQMPRPFSVKINYQPSELDIKVNGGKADVQVQRREPTIQHRRWETDIYLKQKNSISFQVVGHQVNRQL